MLGEILRKHNRHDAARDFYERALHQDPSQPAYHVRLGGTYMLLIQYDKALQVFQPASQRFPRSPEIQYFIGLAARGLANYELAEQALRKSLSLKENVDTLAQPGFILAEHDRNAEAETFLRRAIAVDARHFYANYDLGRLLVRTRRFDEAITALQGAMSIRPRDPGVHYQLFISYSRLKQKEAADRELALFKQYEAERKARRANEEESIEDTLPRPANNEKPN